MRRLQPIIGSDTPIATPYGATECLPVAVTDSSQIFGDHETKTGEGAGVFVGPPVENLNLRIIPITDEVHPELPAGVAQGTIGEICVQAAQATEAYWRRDTATARAKCHDEHGHIWHRMGDAGYLDEAGQLWFCGRVAHRVELATGPLYSTCVEGIANAVPGVFRSALIHIHDHSPEQARASAPTVDRARNARPPIAGLCFECTPEAQPAATATAIAERLRQFQQPIGPLYHHTGFPVDIRHNAKINRPALSEWAINAQPIHSV
jgi:acyl-CoA synthetase (AMP-forming)/AMP-acid ligase II